MTPTTTGASLRLRDVAIRYPDGSTPVRGTDLDVAAGEIVALVGASGSGKSTLLGMMTRFTRADVIVVGLIMHVLASMGAYLDREEDTRKQRARDRARELQAKNEERRRLMSEGRRARFDERRAVATSGSSIRNSERRGS